jgi:hypothetical protein
MRDSAKLLVNADGVTPDAPLIVELLDDKLKVIKAANVTRSGTRLQVLTLPEGRGAVRLSWNAGSAAKLYALYVND